MPEEVLLYGPIFNQSSIDFINGINEVEDDELVVRVNSNGGDVALGWGMITKFKEFEGPKSVKADGAALSMAFNFILYADSAESNDVSRFMVHRAGFAAWYEENFMTDTDIENLKAINASLERAFRNKVDVEVFEEMKDVKVKDIFSMDNRVEVWLTAAEAKKIGLIDKITKITPVKKQKINAEMVRIAASYAGEETTEFIDIENIDVPSEGPSSIETEVKPSKTEEKMTLEELKSKHPEAFAQAKAQGAKEELDRVGAWLEFNDVDPKAVAEGIKSGDDLSRTAMAGFTRKMISGNTLDKIEEEAPGATATETEEAPNASTNPELDKFEAEVKAQLVDKTEKQD